MKYTKPILLFFLIFIPMVVLLSSTSGPVALVILIYPFSAIIGALIGYVLAPLFLFVYKKLIGRKLLYGIQDRPNPEKFSGTLKGFFPALMAANFSLSLIFSPTIMDFPLFSGFYTEWQGIILLFFILGGITIGVAIILFSAVWTIMDAGIVSTNKEKVENKRDPVELRSVGGWYLAFLKGYAGISVLIGLYTFLINLIDTYGNEVHFSVIIFFAILPLIIAIWIIPAIIIFDKTYENRKKYVLKFSKKIGIKQEIHMKIIKAEILKDL
ncbi:MAG: hypothetical protein V3V33_09380 [Candidatus Lokiarchaeia archaeon]